MKLIKFLSKVPLKSQCHLSLHKKNSTELSLPRFVEIVDIFCHFVEFLVQTNYFPHYRIFQTAPPVRHGLRVLETDPAEGLRGLCLPPAGQEDQRRQHRRRLPPPHPQGTSAGAGALRDPFLDEGTKESAHTGAAAHHCEVRIRVCTFF